MSIWLKNEVEKLAERVTVLEAQGQPKQAAPVDLSEILKRLAELEEQAHTHNFGRKKKA